MAEKKQKTGRRREILGIILFALGIFLAICLVSFDRADPFFGTDPTLLVRNYGGYVGAYFAAALMWVMGVSAFWVPLLLVVASIKLFIRGDFRLGPALVSGILGLILSTAGLAALASIVFGFSSAFAVGGKAGAALARFFVLFLKPTGAFIFLSVGLAVSLIITIDFSLVGMVKKAAVFLKLKWQQLRRAYLIRQITKPKPERVAEPAAPPPEPPPKPKEPRRLPVISEETALSERSRKKKAEQSTFAFVERRTEFQLPPITLLDEVLRKDSKQRREILIANSLTLEKKLSDFGVEGKVVEVKPGPVITIYELEPAPGVKINRITNLSEDLAMALRAPSVRIAPIPGKAVVGIEIPNEEREPVHLRNVLDNELFADSKYHLPVALGEDTVGVPVLADLARMPHLLIAGTTGSGKSVSLNTMICSILFKATPDEVKFLMIDPKRLELSAYEGIPHLLHPVVMDPKDSAQVLRWAVAEMERRYRLISEVGAKNIDKYNKLIGGKGRAPAVKEPQEEEEDNGLPAFTATPDEKKSDRDLQLPLVKLPYIVIVIDELADLIMAAQRHVEESLTRLAQMARAAGLHLILATQRPSVDVITGIIKANFPTRISFQVSSKVDSRTILDQLGAENLLGSGDMLFLPPGTARLVRIHGAYVSEKEIERVVNFIKKQQNPQYDESILEIGPESDGERSNGDYDEKYDEAVELVTDLGQASISLVQRYLKVGYNRAARMIEKMEAEGVVGPSDGVKPRKVLARKIPNPKAS